MNEADLSFIQLLDEVARGTDAHDERLAVENPAPQKAALWKAVFSGHVFKGLLWRSECPRHEIVDLTAGMHVDNLRENIRDVALRIDAVELTGLDE